ncbi:MAG: VOC family protein [Acidobacteria bacterium]|nr:VOC family protein [Acidobacteriota bacterium]
MIVERTDFISVPVTDLERSTRFYADTLGLEQVGEGGFPEFQLGDNVSIYLLKLENIGSEFSAPHTAHVALRVPDVAETRRELEARGIEFHGDTLDTGVCHMALYAPRD